MLLWLLVSCADPFGDAKNADTIEAWETFLASDPSGSQKITANGRLEELLSKKADQSKATADYDAVLKRFPNTRKKKKLQEGRSAAAFADAEKTNTAEGWKKFLDENDFADGVLKKKARKRVHAAEYADKLGIGELKVAQINLAEDPKGPMDGWGFTSTITNNGDKSLAYLNIELLLHDDQGGKLKAYTYPAVATSGPGGMPVAEEVMKPLAPGETRTWTYSTGDVPEGWTQKASLGVDDFRYEGAQSLSGEDKP